jgi:hypothetical protein
MALKHRIGKSQTIPFRITSETATQVVVIFSGEVSKVVYQRFSYPQRGDSNDIQDSSTELEWKLLDYEESSVGNIFTGVLDEEATQDIEDDILVMDIKGWDDSGNTRVKRCRLLPIVDTQVQEINAI